MAIVCCGRLPLSSVLPPHQPGCQHCGDLAANVPDVFSVANDINSSLTGSSATTRDLAIHRPHLLPHSLESAEPQALAIIANHTCNESCKIRIVREVLHALKFSIVGKELPEICQVLLHISVESIQLLLDEAISSLLINAKQSDPQAKNTSGAAEVCITQAGIDIHGSTWKGSNHCRRAALEVTIPYHDSTHCSPVPHSIKTSANMIVTIGSQPAFCCSELIPKGGRLCREPSTQLLGPLTKKPFLEVVYKLETVRIPSNNTCCALLHPLHEMQVLVDDWAYELTGVVDPLLDFVHHSWDTGLVLTVKIVIDQPCFNPSGTLFLRYAQMVVANDRAGEYDGAIAREFIDSLICSFLCSLEILDQPPAELVFNSFINFCSMSLHTLGSSAFSEVVASAQNNSQPASVAICDKVAHPRNNGCIGQVPMLAIHHQPMVPGTGVCCTRKVGLHCSLTLLIRVMQTRDIHQNTRGGYVPDVTFNTHRPHSMGVPRPSHRVTSGSLAQTPQTVLGSISVRLALAIVSAGSVIFRCVLAKHVGQVPILDDSCEDRICIVFPCCFDCGL
mmetsp:Transcript_36885/g.104100  ORF Transcript_36885/g.104100 Transcript_36885/m.104100 type:complete len:561 (+) Transcript_36885:602-2284(+)